VDSSAKTGKVIQENLRRLNLTDRTKVWTMPVARALRFLARHDEIFDMIFLDPPYEYQWIDRTLKIIAQEGLLRDSGVLIAEHSIRERVESHYGSLALDDQRRYGSTLLSFFRHETQKSTH
jgi:16S rRNA (guanine(966)-N(2))-methyltransferase RsmD